MKELAEQAILAEKAKEYFLTAESILSKLPGLGMSMLKNDRSCIVLIDLNKGFAQKGALASERIDALTKHATRFLIEGCRRGYPIFPYTDCHSPQSPELVNYPAHCMAGTDEPQLVDSLRFVDNLVRPKNSTNAFFANIDELLDPKYDNYIVMGCCTDICIEQFAVALKAFFNQNNLTKRVVVPTELVDTYDSPTHPADIMNLYSLLYMKNNGVQVVKELIWD